MTRSPGILSETIREAVRIAGAAGNNLEIITQGWKPRQVAFMERPITSELRAEILAALQSLEHSLTEATAKAPGAECFIDRENDVVLAFLAPGEERGWY